MDASDYFFINVFNNKVNLFNIKNLFEKYINTQF